MHGSALGIARLLNLGHFIDATLRVKCRTISRQTGSARVAVGANCFRRCPRSDGTPLPLCGNKYSRAFRHSALGRFHRWPRCRCILQIARSIAQHCGAAKGEANLSDEDLIGHSAADAPGRRDLCGGAARARNGERLRRSNRCDPGNEFRAAAARCAVVRSLAQLKPGAPAHRPTLYFYEGMILPPPPGARPPAGLN